MNKLLLSVFLVGLLLIVAGCTVKSWPPRSVDECNLFASKATRWSDDIYEKHSMGECYSYFAQKDKKPELCEKIENLDSRDTCYWAVATGAKDKASCEKIAANEAREKCRNYFK